MQTEKPLNHPTQPSAQSETPSIAKEIDGTDEQVEIFDGATTKLQNLENNEAELQNEAPAYEPTV